MTELSLFKRLEMLSDTWTYRVYNNAVQLVGLKNEVSGLEWVTDITSTTCNYCDGQSGRIYKMGQFIPDIPAHPNCHCQLRVIEK